MSFADIFINNKTGILRSGWRALTFLALFYFLIGFMDDSGKYMITFRNYVKLSSSMDLAISGIFSLIVIIPISIWMIRVIDKMTATSLGFKFNNLLVKKILISFLAGSVISAISIWILISNKVLIISVHDQQLLNSLPFYGVISWLFVVVLIDTIGEEFVLRGYLQQTLARGIGLYPSLLVTALIFAFLKAPHLKDINYLEIMTLVFMSIALSLAMFKSASIWIPCALHAGWDMLQTFIGLKGYNYGALDAYYTINNKTGFLYNGTTGIDGSLLGIIGWIIIIAIIYFMPLGKYLSDHWWQFTDNIHLSKMRVWDFCINNRNYFQWKIADNTESGDDEEE